MQRAERASTIALVEPGDLISRGEVTGRLFALADINVNVDRIVDLLEEGLDGEEELPEEDS